MLADSNEFLAQVLVRLRDERAAECRLLPDGRVLVRLTLQRELAQPFNGLLTCFGVPGRIAAPPVVELILERERDSPAEWLA